MKKTIGKPENWQDFESLCKRLWGEIWNIPNSIKKNGRSGQNQSGVDVFGIPKSENSYWGIQCKGKDDYSNAKLNILEIDNEIEKAKNFIPKLSVYIIATTANKDAKIEEHVRVKDLESRKDGLEIHLFCWEDIVDLLEECNDTYNWYLNGIGQKNKFDFLLSFNNFEEEILIKPIFEKNITKYVLTNGSPDFFSKSLNIKIPTAFDLISEMHFSTKINKSWCDFEIVLQNVGKKVIEDWHFKLNFTEGVRKIYDEFESIYSMSTPLNLRRVYVDESEKSLKYYPLKNEPLIQKDNRFFEVSILPIHDAEIVCGEWELLARDFNINGSFKLRVKPQFVEKIDEIKVYSANSLKTDTVIISDYVVDSKEGSDD